MDRLKNFQKGTIMAKIQAKMLDDETGQDNWIDLAAQPPSRDSTCSVTMCSDPNLLVDAQKSADASRHSFSPKSLQSPNVEFDTTLEAVKYKLARDVLPPGRNTDWIWDWSSRPEVHSVKQQGAPSNLVTPPNSPIPVTEHSLSLRHSNWIRKPWFSFEVVSVWLVSNMVTFVLGVCVGYFIIRRNSNFLGSKS